MTTPAEESHQDIEEAFFEARLDQDTHETLNKLRSIMLTRAEGSNRAPDLIVDAWELVRLATECFKKYAERDYYVGSPSEGEILALWRLRAAFARSDAIQTGLVNKLFRELLIGTYERAAKEFKDTPVAS